MVSLPMASGSTKMGLTSKVTLDQTSQREKDSGHSLMVTRSPASIPKPNVQMLKAMRSNFLGELLVTFLTEQMLKIRFPSNSNTLSNVCMHHLFSIFSNKSERHGVLGFWGFGVLAGKFIFNFY